MYRVGEGLRKRYNSFLGDYTPDVLYAYSTEKLRAIASLQALLTSLFPPQDDLLWTHNHWQPIPYIAYSFKEDSVCSNV